MGWETRSGQRYYYRKTRKGNTVTSEYVPLDKAALTIRVDKKLRLDQHLAKIAKARTTQQNQTTQDCHEALIEAILEALVGRPSAPHPGRRCHNPKHRSTIMTNDLQEFTLRYPALDFIEADGEVRVGPKGAEPTITIIHSQDRWTVSTEVWHGHYGSTREALDMAVAILGGLARTTAEYRQDKLAASWLEIWEETSYASQKVAYYLNPFDKAEWELAPGVAVANRPNPSPTCRPARAVRGSAGRSDPTGRYHRNRTDRTTPFDPSERGNVGPLRQRDRPARPRNALDLRHEPQPRIPSADGMEASRSTRPQQNHDHLGTPGTGVAPQESESPSENPNHSG